MDKLRESFDWIHDVRNRLDEVVAFVEVEDFGEAEGELWTAACDLSKAAAAMSEVAEAVSA